MNWLISRLAKIRLLKGDFDYNVVRASMVILYFFFGYQKWFDYEAKELVPFFTNQAFTNGAGIALFVRVDRQTGRI